MKYLQVFLTVGSNRAAILLTWLLLATTSPADNFTTPPDDTIRPSIPGDVIASANSGTEITVEWNASTDIGGSGVKGYRIFRDGILCGLATTTSFSDAGLAPDTEYCYTVDAFDYQYDRSPASAQACATTPPDDTIRPSIPGDVIASANSGTEITVEWNASTDIRGSGVNGYRIFRDGILCGLATTTNFFDAGLAPDRQYCYTVDAFDNQYNRSPASAQACATTLPSLGPAPAAPSNLAVIAVGNEYVTLNWEDNSNDELGFVIEQARSPDGPWSLAATTGANATSYYIHRLAPSTTYYYRVSAFN